MPPRVRVKICGITRPEDAAEAARCGADAIGLNFVPESPRVVSIDQARAIVEQTPAFVVTVGVFVNEKTDRIEDVLRETGISTVQLHGADPPDTVAALTPIPVIRAFRWQGRETADEIDAYLDACRNLGRLPAGVLIDTHRKGIAGGTGQAWDWREAERWSHRVPRVIAGGLTPENVAAAIKATRPYAVDTAGGVESSPAIKDSEKLRAFVEAVRHAT